MAQRARYQVAPRSLEKIGPTEELAQFVVSGIVVHLALTSAYFLYFAFCHRDYAEVLRDAYLRQSTEAFLLSHHWFITLYLLLSFSAGWVLGFAQGVMSIKQPLRNRATRFLSKFRLSLMINRPIVWSFFQANGQTERTFVQVEMADGKGFYSGQLYEYALVADEEPHKAIWIIKVYFKQVREGTYEPILGDGILLDLADAVAVEIKRIPAADVEEDTGN